ncbi:hypothetical protein BGZ79_003034, partial [Entomortierella chlamydospora]
ILLNSPEQQYFDQGRRLRLCWESPGNGLGTFWQELKDAKTASDIEDAARDNIRKHSIRSAERNVLGVIHNLNDQNKCITLSSFSLKKVPLMNLPLTTRSIKRRP